MSSPVWLAASSATSTFPSASSSVPIFMSLVVIMIISGSRPQGYVVAHIVADCTPYVPTPAVSATSLDINKLGLDQFQSLIQQFITHVKASDPLVPYPLVASVTYHGFMAAQSTSGMISLSFIFPSSFPSTSLRFENDHLTFQHQALSILSNHFSHGSWIIDSGATSHVCSDMTLFKETIVWSYSFIT